MILFLPSVLRAGPSYSIISCGAFAAHTCGFKKGCGVYSMEKELAALKIKNSDSSLLSMSRTSSSKTRTEAAITLEAAGKIVQVFLTVLILPSY